VAFLTGPPFVGKTTICRRIEENGIPVLHNDEEVFHKAFRRIGKPEMGQAIKPLDHWASLRKTHSFDELLADIHREWYMTKGSPPSFTAVGWIYSRIEWREHACRALEVIPDVKVEPKLFVIKPSTEDYFVRYDKAQWERFGGAYHQHKELDDAGRRRKSADFYTAYLTEDLQPSGGMEVVETDGVDLLNRIESFCKGT
jgi:hypothetical protein